MTIKYLSTIMACAVCTVSYATSPQSVCDAPETRNYVSHVNERPLPKGEDSPLATTEIITNPTGRKEFYTRASNGIYPMWGAQMTYYEEKGTTVEVVFGENNEVYLKDILSYGKTGSYVKGVIDNGKITVSLPQTVLFDEAAGDYVNLVVLKPLVFDDETWTYVTDRECDAYTYTLKDDGSFVMDPPGFNGAIGFSFASDGEWGMYCDFAQTFNPFGGKLVEEPEHLQKQKWAFRDGTMGSAVDVAFDDNEIYMRGICSYFPDSWIKGRVEGDKVYISDSQYLGVYMDAYFIYLMFQEDRVDSEGNVQTILCSPGTEFAMQFDADKKALASADKKIMLFNGSLSEMMPLDIVSRPLYVYQGSYAGIPCQPEGLYFRTDNREYYGYSSFGFNLPMISTDDKVLDSREMFYNIFIDGDKITIEKDVYCDIAEDMVDIPYYYNNFLDVWDRGYTLHQVGIYPANPKTVGVQTVYKHDGIETRSAIVELDIASGETTVGIEETGIDGRVPVAVEYFDISGRRVVAPSAGMMLIRRTTFDDGSVAVDKVAK